MLALTVLCNFPHTVLSLSSLLFKVGIESSHKKSINWETDIIFQHFRKYMINYSNTFRYSIAHHYHYDHTMSHAPHPLNPSVFSDLVHQCISFELLNVYGHVTYAIQIM